MTTTPHPGAMPAAVQGALYRGDPALVATQVDRVRTVVDRLLWTGMVAGLLFTMTNVQHFAAAGAVAWSPRWCIAWLLDPTVSLVLLGVLFAQRLTSRYQVAPGPWTRYGKWALLGATYVMNTWAFWAAGNAAGVVLHSVPPLVVFVAAEAITELQDQLTECVHRAHPTTPGRAPRDTTQPTTAQPTTIEATTGHPAAPGTAGWPVEQEPVAPAARSVVAPAPATAVAVGRPVAARGSTGRRPQASPTGAPAGRGRGRRVIPELAVLVAHAGPILDRDPGLGRRALADRLSQALAVGIPPYWAAKAKTTIEAQHRLHVVEG